MTGVDGAPPQIIARIVVPAELAINGCSSINAIEAKALAPTMLLATVEDGKCNQDDDQAKHYKEVLER